MYKSVLNNVQFFNVIFRPTRFRYKVLYKIISTNRHTNTNETFSTEGSEENVVVEVNNRGVVSMIFFTISKTVWVVTNLVRMEVLDS